MSIKMDVERGYDLAEGLVLHVRERVIEFARVVIVDERYRSHSFVLAGFPLLLDKHVADHIADCLGPRVIAFAIDEVVELFYKLAVDRNAKSGKLGHIHLGVTIFEKVTQQSAVCQGVFSSSGVFLRSQLPFPLHP